MREYEFKLYYDFFDNKARKWQTIILIKSDAQVQVKLGRKRPITVLEAWKAYENAAYQRFAYARRKERI